jgi:hypothetical protein
MSSRTLAGAVAILALGWLSPVARADGEALVMDGHDAGHLIYADKCSNGANNDDAGRDRFITALRADAKSQLARTLATAEAKFVTDKEMYEVALGDWIQTYHLRDGCGESSNSYSAFVVVQSKHGNSHELWTKYLVTIDDDVVAERRTLKVRSVVTLSMREH